ncbi:MAG: winged helix-turn-helix transcriptional regulator [Clostridiales bacterium]|nr:winged helix-turn-helix transcriptional regulator [Clostridiales bacterium]
MDDTKKEKVGENIGQSIRFEKFTSLILRINRSVQRIKSEEMAPHGLTGVHVNCLYYLVTSERGMSQAELTRVCREDKAYISRAVAELTKLGMIELKGGDTKKYKSTIMLTEYGREVALRTRTAVDRAVAAGSAGLTDEDREVLYRCLETVSDNLEKYTVEEL